MSQLDPDLALAREVAALRGAVRILVGHLQALGAPADLLPTDQNIEIVRATDLPPELARPGLSAAAISRCVDLLAGR